MKATGRLSSRPRVVKFTNLIKVFTSYHYILSSLVHPFAHFYSMELYKEHTYSIRFCQLYTEVLNLLGC